MKEDINEMLREWRELAITEKKIQDKTRQKLIKIMENALIKSNMGKRIFGKNIHKKRKINWTRKIEN